MPKEEFKYVIKERLQYTKYFAYALRTAADLMENNFVKPYQGFTAEDRFIGVETKNGTPVGIIVWRKDREDNTKEPIPAWILHGFVTPKFRARGLYTRLWEELKQECKNNNVNAIFSGTAVDNKVMQEVMKKQGRIAYNIAHVYYLEPTDYMKNPPKERK